MKRPPNNGMPSLLDRLVLQGIRDESAELAKTCENLHWKTAYWQLSQAADTLDAMQARCSLFCQPAAETATK
jgi:hypothetical protein